MNCVTIVSKAFTPFLHHTMILLDPVCARLTQIPEHELLPRPWYSPPGVLLPEEKVLQDWLVIRTKTQDGRDIEGLLPPAGSGLKSGGS